MGLVPSPAQASSLRMPLQSPAPDPGIGTLAAGLTAALGSSTGGIGETSSAPSYPLVHEATRYSDWASTYVEETGAVEIPSGAATGEEEEQFTDDEDAESPQGVVPDPGGIPLSPIHHLQPSRGLPIGEEVMESGEASTLRGFPRLSPLTEGETVDDTVQPEDLRPPRSSSPKRPCIGPPGATPQPSNQSGNSPFYTPRLRPLLPEHDRDLDTPAAQPAAPSVTAAPAALHAGSSFKNVRRKIHMPPDTISHPANPFASLQPIDEDAHHQADAQPLQPAVNVATGNAAVYFVSSPSGQVPVPRVTLQPPPSMENRNTFASQDVRVRDNAVGISMSRATISQRDDDVPVATAGPGRKSSLPPRDARGKFMKRK